MIAHPQHILERSPPLPGGWTLWGADPVEFHDRLWAGRGVLVVRPGAPGPVARRGPALFLLLDAVTLLNADLAAPIRTLQWQRPPAVRLRVSDPEGEEYRERVECDAAGGCTGIRRFYDPAERQSANAWLTPHAGAAQAWASAPDARASRRRLRDWLGERPAVPMRTLGRVCRDGARAGAWLVDAMQGGPDHAAVFDGVYQAREGVLLHESTRADAGLRIVPPVWVGAGVDLRGRRLLVGPLVIPDAPGHAPAVGPVNWDDVRSPVWRLFRARPNRSFHSVTKRAFDIAFSAGVLAAVAPVFPLIMLAIYLEDGRPFLFAHRRQTAGGRPFPCYKFRTMCRDAEGMKAQLQAKNACDGPQFFIEDDPRLLKVGKFLRRFQLDEFPQFWNVLRGHMSVVGPRPSPDKENQFCPSWREARLSVRPGVTGLWQVRRTRAPETDFQEWIRYDLEYVQHRSWRLDALIIYETVRNLLLPGARRRAAGRAPGVPRRQGRRAGRLTPGEAS